MAEVCVNPSLLELIDQRCTDEEKVPAPKREFPPYNPVVLFAAKVILGYAALVLFPRISPELRSKVPVYVDALVCTNPKLAEEAVASGRMHGADVLALELRQSEARDDAE